jgi:uncharacterized Zn finger protein
MQPPSAIYAQCPSCERETLHRVIKGKLSNKKEVVLEALFKCQECGHRYQDVIRTKKPLTIPVIISEEANSRKETMELAPDEMISLNDEYQRERGAIKITGIETETKRVQKAHVKDIKTLWAKRFDRLKLKISVNKGARTLSRTVWAVPDEEFFIGDIMRIKGLNIMIFAIKTKDKKVKKGSVCARDIVRLYAKAVR